MVYKFIIRSRSKPCCFSQAALVGRDQQAEQSNYLAQGPNPNQAAPAGRYKGYKGYKGKKASIKTFDC
eukprot:654417-Pelagomonas_calceolata.AAC.1